jgi:hypothetical protein
VYADYQAINATPGVSPGLQMQPPETATTVRVQDGKTLTSDGPFVEIKESIGGWQSSAPPSARPSSDRRGRPVRPALAADPSARRTIRERLCGHRPGGDL